MQNNSELQNRINRIQRMEQYLDEVLNVMRNNPSSITTDVAICEKIAALTEYYENGQWLQDYDCDARGELPTDLKRGVLAQDTLYDLLGEVSEVERGTTCMDIWEQLYLKAKEQYHPEEVSPFVYAHHVVCALESEDGQIFTGFCIESCSGVLDLCAERTAALNMYINSGQTVVKRLIAFRDKAPFGEGSGMPCGACREFFMQLNIKNKDMEIMVDYEKREIVTLEKLLPDWWGMYRYKDSESNNQD